MRQERPSVLVLKRLDNWQAKSAIVAKAIQRIEDAPKLNVSDIAGELGYTPRHFRRLFRQDIGIPPKDFIQIIRVKHILIFLENGRQGRLTDLAYELGFSDQSHLNRVFKKYTGQSPRTYLLGKSQR